ncbi:MAG: helicase, partial [Marmoricola sp.]
MDLEALVDRLGRAPARADCLTHLEVLDARPEQAAAWPTWLGAPVRTALEGIGVSAPWTHQATGADLAHAGQHIVVATGTSSGKSLCYLMPGLQAIDASRGPKGQRGA